MIPYGPVFDILILCAFTAALGLCCYIGSKHEAKKAKALRGASRV